MIEIIPPGRKTLSFMTLHMQVGTRPTVSGFHPEKACRTPEVT